MVLYTGIRVRTYMYHAVSSQILSCVQEDGN